MPPAQVVQAFNPGENREACFGLSLPATPGNQFTIKAGEKTRGHGVVFRLPTVPTESCTPISLANGLPNAIGALAALVGAVNHRLGLSGHQDNVERRNHQVRSHTLLNAQLTTLQLYTSMTMDKYKNLSTSGCRSYRLPTAG
jgi:hypothetical protein